jgi:DNA-binding XRE family transcriptional regulator
VIISSMEVIRRNILNLLKMFRLKHGLTQQKMAVRLGTSLRTYQRIEGGEAEPSLSQLIKIGMELELQIEQLLYTQETNELNQKKLSAIPPTGGWFYDLNSKHLHWTRITRLIHEAPEDFLPTLESALSYFKEGMSREIATRAIEQTIKSGAEFEVEVQLRTFNGHEIVVCVKGFAEQVNGKTVGLHGSYQDVTAKYNLESRISVQGTSI